MIIVNKMKVIRTVIILLSVVFLYVSLLMLPEYFYSARYVSSEIYESNIIEDICIIAIFLTPPIIIAVYGFITKDTIMTMIIGALLSACLSVFSFRPSLFVILSIFLYYPIISVTAGLEGYFAAKRRLRPTITLGILWFSFAWFFGIIFFSH